MSATVIGLLLCETGLRLFPPSFLAQTAPHDLREFVSYDPVLGWTNRPGARGVSSFEKEFEHEVAIDSDGLRSPPSPPGRSGRRRRVLCLGDSFTFGSGVAGELAFPAVLETLLGPDYDVLNAGVAGWGTLQELLWFENDGMRFRPSTLILGFYINDFEDNVDDGAGRAPRPAFDLASGEPRFQFARLEAGSSPVDRFRIVQLVERAAARLRRRQPEALADPRIADRRLPVASAVTRRVLQRFRAVCMSRGIGFRVLLIPGKWDVRPELRDRPRGLRESRAYDEALCLVDELGAAHVDPRDSFRQAEARNLRLYYEVDIHLNAAGYRLLAELATPLARPAP